MTTFKYSGRNKQDGDGEGVGGCVVSLVIIAGLLLVLWFGGQFWNDWNSSICRSKWPAHDTQWSMFIGCQVLTDEGWVPSENYRVLD